MAIKNSNWNIHQTKDYSSDITKKSNSVRSFQETKDDWGKYLSLWRSYPDYFIDFIKPPNCKIDLYFYQRVMLRVLFRYQKVYFTFTRGTAKSFTQILAIYLKCIFYPGTHLFICAPTKEQAAKISQENIEKIWQFFPVLQGELEKHYFNKDSTKLKFHNGSIFDVVIVGNAARGGRRNGGAVEEIADEKIKKKELNEVVIPLMANDRIAACGGVDPSEIHKFEFYVTTSGTRQSFAFEKLEEISAEMAQGKSAFSLGAGYELACMHNQLSLDFINSLRERPTFNPLSFAREYESVWTGTSDNSLVQLEDLKMCRTLSKAEEKHCGDKDVDYVLSYDVARAEGAQNAQCALCVFKIIPRGDGTYQKHLVNIYSFEGTHFLDQALFLKKKVNDFKAMVLIVDTNGLGKGLVDFLVTEIDENPPYSVTNDDRYDKYKAENSVQMVYAMQSNTKDNKSSDIHNIFMGAVSLHQIKMLHTESEAKQAIDSRNRKTRDAEKEAKELLPFTMVDVLQEEIMNLEYKQSGNQTQVKQISRTISKDKFSACEYGLFYIHTLENKNKLKKKEKFDASKFFVVKIPTSRLNR